MLVPMRFRRLVTIVLSVLTPDLLKEEFRGSKNPVAGHCFHTSEAIAEIVRYLEKGWKPRYQRVNGVSHWYLKNEQTDEILDATSSQFEAPVPYHLGQRKGFIPSSRSPPPSKRAREVLRRVALLSSSRQPRPDWWPAVAPHLEVTHRLTMDTAPRFDYGGEACLRLINRSYRRRRAS